MTAPFLQACLNGGREVGEHPALPCTADALAADAAKAWTAGAHGVHVHPRDATGAQTLAPGACAETIAAIRVAAPHLEISVTTARAVDHDVDRRIGCIHAWTVLPDCASVNFGEEGAAELCRALWQRGVDVEAGVEDAAGVDALLSAGVLDRCRRVLVEVADPDPAAAVEHARALDERLEWAGVLLPALHHGAGRATWAVVVAASRTGRDVRIGLEDTLELPDGRRAPSNEAMVRAVSELQRRAARPA